jgi:hypothetical protein
VVADSPAAAGQHDLGTRRAASYRSSEPCREWRVRGVHLDWSGI